MDPSRHGALKLGEDEDCDESSESTGVRSRVTGRLVAKTSPAVLWGRAAPAGGQGTAAATSLRGAAIKEIPGTPLHSSPGTPQGFVMSIPPATSAGVNACECTASPGASVKSSLSVSEKDEADESPSPDLGRRAARELRWLGGTPVFQQGRTCEEKRRLDLDSAALFVVEALATEELQE